MTNEWMKPEDWRNDMNEQDRDFWKAHNKRKHVYWMNYQQEQREAFREQAAKPLPEQKPITGRVLEIKR